MRVTGCVLTLFTTQGKPSSMGAKTPWQEYNVLLLLLLRTLFFMFFLMGVGLYKKG